MGELLLDLRGRGAGPCHLVADERDQLLACGPELVAVLGDAGQVAAEHFVVGRVRVPEPGHGAIREVQDPGGVELRVAVTALYLREIRLAARLSARPALGALE